MGRSPGRQGSAVGEEQVLALVREHAGDLLRWARRFSLCADDAQDAYQRTLEKLVRRMRAEPPENAVRWAQTVVRHEALAIRAEREQTLGRLALEDDRHRDTGALDPAERVERFERLAHTAEALRGLKPQEMTALALRAEGLSYKEICARTGWSYTRCNRAVSEGRRALLLRLEEIESGVECERWLPLLSLLADGEATARELAELRPHLRSCTACRATLRGFHAAPGQLAALLPVAALPAAVAAGGAGAGGLGIGRHLEAALQSLSERANTAVLRLHGVIDAVPSTKFAAVAASTVAVAGGGAAIEQAATAGAGAGAAGGSPAPAVAAAGPSQTAAATPISASLPGANAPAGGPADPAAGASAGAGGAGSAAGGTPSTIGASAGGPFAEFALEPLAASSGALSAGSGAATSAADFGARVGAHAGTGRRAAGAGAGTAGTGSPVFGATTASSKTTGTSGAAGATDGTGAAGPSGAAGAPPDAAPGPGRRAEKRPAPTRPQPDAGAGPTTASSSPEFTAATAPPPAPPAAALPSRPATPPSPAAPSGGPEFAGP